MFTARCIVFSSKSSQLTPNIPQNFYLCDEIFWNVALNKYFLRTTLLLTLCSRVVNLIKYPLMPEQFKFFEFSTPNWLLLTFWLCRLVSYTCRQTHSQNGTWENDESRDQGSNRVTEKTTLVVARLQSVNGKTATTHCIITQNSVVLSYFAVVPKSLLHGIPVTATAQYFHLAQYLQPHKIPHEPYDSPPPLTQKIQHTTSYSYDELVMKMYMHVW
jgi:hypothetical protein